MAESLRRSGTVNLLFRATFNSPPTLKRDTVALQDIVHDELGLATSQMIPSFRNSMISPRNEMCDAMLLLEWGFTRLCFISPYLSWFSVYLVKVRGLGRACYLGSIKPAASRAFLFYLSELVYVWLKYSLILVVLT